MLRLQARLRSAIAATDQRRRKRRNMALIKVAQKPAPVDPIWPLPRHMSEERVRSEFARFDQWHYAYEFEGGLHFEVRHNRPAALADERRRPLMRFRHFMPWLVDACGGSLLGKSVLDIACNSGFWSIQCALLGADVVGFDARPELIEQANLLKSITGVENATFRELDFWQMNPDALGRFDAVLNLGILYHLPKPLEALELTRAMGDIILLDTAVSSAPDPVMTVKWEEPTDVRNAADAGIVVNPSKTALEIMFRHLHLDAMEIPLSSSDMPADYLTDRRASWLLRASDQH